MLIKCYGERANSYTLVLILDRYFEIFEFGEVSTRADNNGFSTAVRQPNTTHNFTITPLGIEYLKTIGGSYFIDELDKRYPNPIEMITFYRDRFIKHFPN